MLSFFLVLVPAVFICQERCRARVFLFIPIRFLGANTYEDKAEVNSLLERGRF